MDFYFYCAHHFIYCAHFDNCFLHKKPGIKKAGKNTNRRKKWVTCKVIRQIGESSHRVANLLKVGNPWHSTKADVLLKKKDDQIVLSAYYPKDAVSILL